MRLLIQTRLKRSTHFSIHHLRFEFKGERISHKLYIIRTFYVYAYLQIQTIFHTLRNKERENSGTDTDTDVMRQSHDI